MRASSRPSEAQTHRNYIIGRVGDRMNALVAAGGYNFGLLLRWLAALLLPSSARSPRGIKRSSKLALVRVLQDDYVKSREGDAANVILTAAGFTILASSSPG